MLIIVIIGDTVAGKEVKTILFKDANAAMQAAKEAQADVLAPDNFGEAMKRYQKAETDLTKEKNLDDIRKSLRESTAYFKKAINATKLAEVTFPNSMKARKDAKHTEEEEKSALAQQIASQAKTRELFSSVEESFSREEARMLREGNDIIIRLVGLNFPTAKATIEQQSFGLLSKVRNAINSFPECTVSVLGNTDSYGGDEQNLQLSKERAAAVKKYLLANSDLNAYRVEAIGYGESKPIASNETEAGRAANRRVDVVIHPRTAKGTFSDNFSK